MASQWSDDLAGQQGASGAAAGATSKLFNLVNRRPDEAARVYRADREAGLRDAHRIRERFEPVVDRVRPLVDAVEAQLAECQAIDVVFGAGEVGVEALRDALRPLAASAPSTWALIDACRTEDELEAAAMTLFEGLRSGYDGAFAALSKELLELVAREIPEDIRRPVDAGFQDDDSLPARLTYHHRHRLRNKVTAVIGNASWADRVLGRLADADFSRLESATQLAGILNGSLDDLLAQIDRMQSELSVDLLALDAQPDALRRWLLAEAARSDVELDLPASLPIFPGLSPVASAVELAELMIHNPMKHGGPGRSREPVRLVWEDVPRTFCISSPGEPVPEGFSLDAREASMDRHRGGAGLLGLRQRLAAVGGEVHLAPRPDGRGNRLRVHWGRGFDLTGDD